MFGLPDMPVASTSWVGCRVISLPSRMTVTLQRPASSKAALQARVFDQ
jgi:hypothetical protein